MVDALFDICARNAATIEKIDCFKNWIRSCVRPLLPHGALVCVHGRTHGLGVSVEYVVTVDFPVKYLLAIRNSSGHMDTPIARLWYQHQAPIFFDANHPLVDMPETWFEHFSKHSLSNIAADGVLDKPRCLATYFSFHQLPALNEMELRCTFKILTPLLHETITRVVRHDQKRADSIECNYRLLTNREQEIATFISHGKSNGVIAQLLCLSENTVRNHVSRIFDKTGCSNRAGLANIVLLHEQSQFGIGMKVL